MMKMVKDKKLAIDGLGDFPLKLETKPENI
jgi:hypothetical protein